MKVGKSVQKAIDEWTSGDAESSMLHACNAVDGTARNAYPKLKSNGERFTQLLRNHYFILGPMGMPGVDLERTRFPVVVRKSWASDGRPDLADVIYGIHRCSHGHGDELPNGFELIENASGSSRLTTTYVEKGALRLSDRIIFGLLAVAVFHPVNIGHVVPDGYFLTFGNQPRMEINKWWGRASDFTAISEAEPVPLIKLDFGDWMDAVKTKGHA